MCGSVLSCMCMHCVRVCASVDLRPATCMWLASTSRLVLHACEPLHNNTHHLYYRRTAAKHVSLTLVSLLRGYNPLRALLAQFGGPVIDLPSIGLWCFSRHSIQCLPMILLARLPCICTDDNKQYMLCR